MLLAKVHQVYLAGFDTFNAQAVYQQANDYGKKQNGQCSTPEKRLVLHEFLSP
jgi:hypothetical protein